MAYRVFPTPSSDPVDDQPRAFGRRSELRRQPAEPRRAARTKLVRGVELAALALGLGALGFMLIGAT